MHPIVVSELARQHQAELLRDAAHHRLAATLRRPRTVTFLRRWPTRRCARPLAC